MTGNGRMVLFFLTFFPALHKIYIFYSFQANWLCDLRSAKQCKTKLFDDSGSWSSVAVDKSGSGTKTDEKAAE